MGRKLPKTTANLLGTKYTSYANTAAAHGYGLLPSSAWPVPDRAPRARLTFRPLPLRPILLLNSSNVKVGIIGAVVTTAAT